MHMKKSFLVWFVLGVGIFLTSEDTSFSQTLNYEKALSYYSQNKLDQALPYFEEAVAEQKGNPDVYAWLAETLRRLNRKPEAITAARKALALNPCNSFAHEVISDLENPMYGEWEEANEDSSWIHLKEAVRCDSSDGNAWIDLWIAGIKRQNILLMDESARRMVETGFMTHTILSYARWFLRALPPDAVLITNGDMDTFPLSAVQVSEGFRKDVAVVNRSLLNTSWYARFVRDIEKVPLPYNDNALDTLTAVRDSSGNIRTVSDGILQAWLREKREGTFSRPLAVACTAEPGFLTSDSTHMTFAGPFYIWTAGQRATSLDTSFALASFDDVQPEEFEGMWASMQDRSSVRISSTKTNVMNVLYVASMLSRAMMDARRNDAALHWLTWAEKLNNACELGPVYTKYIDEIKSELKEARDQK